MAALAVAGLALGCASGAALVLGAGKGVARAAGTVVSQRGRAFSPGIVTVPRGLALTVVNDDGHTIHHAYVDQGDFKYDSGDQEPGDRATIYFPETGDYTVMCGIHPKMRMSVNVR